ncbi:monoglyceride lipase-like [Saccostrea echinata]|uniref:monoglyceride lipase-like n=1 Tax=Saccostrea echinata TaxID=191078 RepID=UPI002A7F3AC9|nr:monoglyceride lipase-like [Saccostrea echinata]
MSVPVKSQENAFLYYCLCPSLYDIDTSLIEVNMTEVHLSSGFERFNDGGPLMWVRKWTEVDQNSVETSRKALLFVSHGLGEHSGWYDELGSLLAGSGILVFSHDHVGHGKSPGIHNHIDDFKEYTSVIFDHCSEMKKKYPDLPLFLFGHSMGGAVAILAALENKTFFSGVITSAPFVIPTKGLPSKVELFFMKNMIARLCPQRKLFFVDSKEVTRDPDMIKRFEEDPLIHPFFKAKFGVAWLSCSEIITKNLESISWPFLAIHGDADNISDVKFSQDMFHKAKSLDKEIKIYPGFLHAPLYEPEEDRQLVFSDIKQWLEKRI